MNVSRTTAGALVAVAVTLAAAVIGGTASGRATEPRTEGTQASLGARTFACTGGLPESRVLHGTTVDGLTDDELPEAMEIEVPEGEARGGFASQVAREGASFAMSLCPEPRNDWWFVGAGGSIRHASTVTVENPRPGAAVVNIEVFGAGGEVEAPGLTGITLAGGTRRSFDLEEVAPAVGDLVVHVRAHRGLVSVAATDSYALSSGVDDRVREWLPDQYRPARTLLLTGLQRRPAKATLVLANPGDAETLVSVEVVGEKGTFIPKGLEKVSVPPHSLVHQDIVDAFDGQPAAVRLKAGAPIVATVRSSRAGDQSLAVAASPLRGPTVIGVPAADNRDIVLTGLADGEVRVVAYGPAGKELDEQQVKVAKDASTLVRLPPKARYVLLAADHGVAVASLLAGYGSGGVSAIAVPPGARALRVPAVRPGW